LFDNRWLRRVFGPSGENVGHNLYILSNVNGMREKRKAISALILKVRGKSGDVGIGSRIILKAVMIICVGR